MLTNPDADLRPAPRWHVSSRCSTGDCVAVAQLAPGTIGVRDTKDPAGPVLTFSATDWNAFVERVRRNP